jgi:peptidoglycan/LPS O-acetylase OafA/YrhL
MIVVILVKRKNPLVSKGVDKIIGDYSYPIYLMHWQVGLFVSLALWGTPIRDKSFEGFLTFGVAVILCFLFSFVIIKKIDGPIENLRRRVRNR